MGNSSTDLNLRNIVRSVRANLVFLTETHIMQCNESQLYNVLDFHHIFSALSAWKGGLILFWTNDIQLQIIQSTSYRIRATISSGVHDWDMACIYGQLSQPLRKVFWDHYTALLSTVTNPLLCFGDFNEPLKYADKWGGIQVKVNHTSDLRNFTNILGLLYLGYIGPTFT